MDILNISWSFIDWTTILLAFFVFCLTSTILHRLYVFKTFIRLGIPGPKPNFIFGNFHELQGSNNPMKVIMGWLEKYGDKVGYYEGWRPVMLVKDSEMLQLILIKYFRKFINRPVGTIKPPPPFQYALTSLQSDDWKHMRNALTPAFSAKKLKQMSGIMNNGIDVTLEIIDEKVKMNQEFDAFMLFKRLTMHVIGESVFAINVNCQRDPNDKFFVAANELFRGNGSFLLYIVACFQSIGPILFKLLQKILRMSLLSKRNFLVETLTDVINIRRQDKEKNTIDMLQLMLDARKLNSNEGSEISNGHLTQEGKQEKSKLNDGELIANSMVFLLAGFETTANALAYTTYLLTKHPEIQQQVQEEIDQIVGKENKPDYETVNKLTKLDQVICESLRMYPIVTLFVSRECVENCDVNGIIIPKGMKVTIPVWQIHHDPSIWPDPFEFRPERFSSDNKPENMSHIWLPFGDGPRNCIGKRFALLEIKTAMARILRKYTLVPGESFEEELELRFLPVVMNPKNGVFIKAVPRD